MIKETVTALAASASIMGLVVDNFAGGGGASTGIEIALGRDVDVAINHDPEAVAMHAANHPGTLHYCQSVWKADPRDVVEAAAKGKDIPINPRTGLPRVGLGWFSPDCKHFSKAKGGKPVEKHIRDLAWVVVQWAQRILPDVIMLENVEEFRTWGPIDAETGKPDKARAGEEFNRWTAALRKLGYRIQWKELRACDYGAPTSRKRFFMIARCDDQPIVWPEATHGKPGSAEVLSGKLKPWRAAWEIIDWSIPCPSIFDRARDLKDATNRRIAAGVMRYVVNAARPFIVGTDFTNTRASRVFDADDPLRTVTSQNAHAVVAPTLVTTTHQGGDRAHDVTEPLRTVTGAHRGEIAIISPTFVGCGGRRGQSAPVDPTAPYPTTTAKADTCLVAGTLVQAGYGEREGQAPRALDLEKPLGTAVAGGIKHAAVASFLSRYYGTNKGGGGDLETPAKTESASGNHTAIVAAHMEQANTGMVGHSAERPVSTIVGRGTTQRLIETTMVPADALPALMMEKAVKVAAFLIKYYGNEADGHGLNAPLGTVTTKDRFAVVTVTIDAATYILVDIGMRMLTPRELASAQSFPTTYNLEAANDNGGKPLTKTAQTRMIGNSVCPVLAEALVRANFPRREEERIAA